MTKPQQASLRERNNAAARRSRLRAVHAQSEPEWLGSEAAGLDEAEYHAARWFLRGAHIPSLSKAARAAIRKHLKARRNMENKLVERLLERLDTERPS